MSNMTKKTWYSVECQSNDGIWCTSSQFKKEYVTQKSAESAIKHNSDIAFFRYRIAKNTVTMEIVWEIVCLYTPLDKKRKA